MDSEIPAFKNMTMKANVRVDVLENSCLCTRAHQGNEPQHTMASVDTRIDTVSF